jgi:type I restriction enzyme S subunit
MKQKPVRYAFDSAPSRARRIVQYGDTIISTVRTYLKSVCFIDCEHKNCIVSTGFSVLTPDKNTVVPELLSFVLSSDEFIDDVIRNSIGVSYPAINDSSLMTLKVALPISLEEQQAIYEKMKRDFSIFDRIIEKINTEITLLGEYRTRLISDVVTGKMDVREVAVPQYEAVEVVVDSDIEENEAEETEKE